MNHKFLMGALALFLAVGLALAAQADTLDTSSYVEARLVFSVLSTLELTPCNVDDDLEVDTVTFVYSGRGDTDMARQYVRVDYGTNMANYKVALYSVNRATRDPNNANWGALVGEDSSHRLSLMWRVEAETKAGGPAWSGWQDNSWVWLKDTGDSDFVQSLADDYTRLLFKDSSRSAAELRSGVSDPASPCYLYLGMLTGGIQPDEYHARLRCDMLHW